MKVPGVGSGLVSDRGSFAAQLAEPRGLFHAPQRRHLIGWALLVVGLLACDGVARKEPSPAGMCRELRDTCRGLGGDKYQLCFRVGAEGVQDPTQEDQCFAVYTGCIADCAFVRQAHPEAADAASYAGGFGDAGLVDASAVERPGQPLGPDTGVIQGADAGRLAPPEASGR